MQKKEKEWLPAENNNLGEGVWKMPFSGLYYIDRGITFDDQGFFREVADIESFCRVTKKEFVPKSVNHSRSITGVVRGFVSDNCDKLMTVVSGEAYMVLCDVREKSKSFGKVISLYLPSLVDRNRGSLYIESGIASALCVVSGPCEYVFAKGEEKSGLEAQNIKLSIFDSDLDIKWPISKEVMILSKEDNDAGSLRSLFPSKFK